MSKPEPPFEDNPPSVARLIKTITVALIGAVIVLVVLILPAEYGIDPTGFGEKLGLTVLSKPQIEMTDAVGGNENYLDIKIPDAGEPIPLPNPAVSQVRMTRPRTDSISIVLQPGQRTEIKALVESAQVLLYSWRTVGGEVYSDFHGHEVAADSDAFVRYLEQERDSRSNGSLVAPFSGEHGWFWINISDKPVTISLDLIGYYRDLIDYGLIKSE